MAATNLQFSGLLEKAVNEPGILSAAYSSFHGYSIGNIMAAAAQCAARQIPLAPIASFNGWKNRGRSVKKGEKAIALCMPVTCKGQRVDATTGETEEFAFSRFVWRNNWFVLSQTAGDDYANEVTTPEWDKTRALAALNISEGTFDHPDGNVQGYASGRAIAVSPIAQHPHKTRMHEMAHVLLGHTTESVMADSPVTPRDVREVEAESVAYILCELLDLPGKVESRGYIQSWLNGAQISEKSAQKIFATADKLLKAGQAKAAETV